jgi:hypothetical protein
MRPNVRYAVVARDDGIRKIGKFTWRAGAAAALCSAAMALAFGHHAAASTTSGGGRSNGSSSGGSIQVPAQPPAPGQGGGQVTSGAS